MKELLLIAICLTGFIACNNKPDLKIEIDKTKQKEIKLQELLPEFKIIPLGSELECQIICINKVELYDNKFYILQHTPSLFAVFNISGECIYKIDFEDTSHHGERHPTDFIIDKKNGQIEFLDGTKKKILIYDLKGNHIRNISTKVKGDFFVKFDDGSYVVDTNNRDVKEMPFKLVRIDKEGKIISRDIPVTSVTIRSNSSPFAKTADDNYLFSEESSDIVYQVTKNTTRAVVSFSQGKEKMPNHCWKDINSYRSNYVNYTVKVGSPMVIGNTLIVEYQSERQSRYLFFDLKKNEAKYFKIRNTHEFGFGTPGISTNQALIGIVYPLSLSRFRIKPRFSIQDEKGDKVAEIESLREKMDESDNPYLIIWKFDPVRREFFTEEESDITNAG